MSRIFVKNTIRELPYSGIRKFFDLASSMKGVISLGVGEPDFTTPWHICEASIYSLEKGYTNYTFNCGLEELRYSNLKNKYGDYNHDGEILVTGASEAIDIALRCVLGPGDEVVFPSCFVSYKPWHSWPGPKIIFTRKPTALN